MKSYYRLVNYQFMWILKPLILVYVGTIISPLFLLNAAMQDYNNIHSRFEDVFASSGCVMAFAIYFAATCGLCIASIYAGYWKSKSIYTLLALPIKREVIYFSELTVFFICFIGLIASQLVGIFLGYALFTPTLVRTINGETYYLRMQNGLFLSLIRSSFFRILLPLGIESFVSSLTTLIATVSTLYYSVLCERSRRYFGFIPVIAVIIFIIYTITQRINMSNANTYINSLILLLCSAFFTWHGVKLVKRSAIA